ncbi:MAG: hypothetical protein H0T46_21150 [Deltaproteobacteria bacterium]|nr:hypothetical protein [Deltaproteobacteria bacterium]
MNRTTALAAVITVLAACSTNYTPRTPGRVFVTMEGGQPTYVRDGQSHRHGFLGGGLQRAVRGNIAAEAAANEYHDRLRDGLLVMLLGGTCATTALVWGVADAAREDPDHDRAATKMLVALGCSVLMMGGAFYTASAEPYRWDAINIFNDSAPPVYPGYGPPPAYGPGYAPSSSVATPAKKRLGMRDD